MSEPRVVKVCAREFTESDLKMIRTEISRSQPPLRAQIARTVCERLDWRDETGRLKTMSARVALLRLHRQGLIELPPPRNSNGNTKGLLKQTVSLPVKPMRIEGSVESLAPVELALVQGRQDSAHWNTLIDQYHYLGYQRLPGAQLRYLICSGAEVLGALGFGAAAWSVGARDQWIGWDRTQRQGRLNRVLNNARFLILPWVRCANLASKVLALSERRVVQDFEERYGVRPVLLETFVERERFRGSCYRAANWVHVGQTQGRGKCDRHHQGALAIKDVYLRPLRTDFRSELGVSA